MKTYEKSLTVGVAQTPFLSITICEGTFVARITEAEIDLYPAYPIQLSLIIFFGPKLMKKFI